jgi:polyphenol oxidase
VGPDSIAPILNNSEPDLFFGTAPDNPDPVASNLEFGPHGGIHLWVGDPIFRDPVGTPDMGVLSTASRDPIFFAHHGNIDRFWDLWLARQPGRTNPPAPDNPAQANPQWLATGWTFFDENSQWVRITTADVIDHEGTLRYRYEAPAAEQAAVVASTTQPQASPSAARAAAPATSAVAAPLAVVSSQTGLTLGPDPVTRSVTLPQEHRAALSTTAQQPQSSYVLRISGIKGPPGGAAIVRVFVNLPSASPATSLSDPHFLGYFTLVPNSLAGSHVHGQNGLNAAFVLGPSARSAIGDAQDLDVTMVPVGLNGDPPFDLTLTVESITLAAR